LFLKSTTKIYKALQSKLRKKSIGTNVDMSVLSRKTSNKMSDWRVKSIYQALKEKGKEHGFFEVSDLVKLGHLEQDHDIKTHTKATSAVCVKNTAWIHKHYKEYRGKWIALNEGILLGAHESLVELKINDSDPLIPRFPLILKTRTYSISRRHKIQFEFQGRCPWL